MRNLAWVDLDFHPEAVLGNRRALHPGQFTARDNLSGHRVILIEDTWVQGGHAQSAAHALKNAGADTVVIIAIGRWVDYSGSDRWRPVLERAPRIQVPRQRPA
ncbi:hypothetical protein [Longispora albida]|uniref:hypothetical protein n=1 Tax=Longispora albida TaxID=203523 RepID=UPI0003A6D111|nr:hypothetical protein [Longispora albida]